MLKKIGTYLFYSFLVLGTLACSLLITAILSGCSSITNPAVTAPGKTTGYSRQDLYVKVDQTLAVYGTAVAPYKETPYKIRIAAPSALDVIFIENCHRQWVEYSKGIAYDGGQYYDFDFSVVAEAEKLSCPLTITTLEKVGRRKSYGTIAFQTPQLTLEADLRCNGRKVAPKGVALCQAKREKSEELHFQEEVQMFTPDAKACPLTNPSRGKDFELSLPYGMCTYSFATFSNPTKRMLFHTIGYDQAEFPEVLQ